MTFVYVCRVRTLWEPKKHKRTPFMSICVNLIIVRKSDTWHDLRWYELMTEILRKRACAPADATTGRALLDDKIEEQRCLRLIIMAHSKIDKKSSGGRASLILVLLLLVTVFIRTKTVEPDLTTYYFTGRIHLRVTTLRSTSLPVARLMIDTTEIRHGRYNRRTGSTRYN